MAKKDGAQVIALTVNRIPLSSYGLATPQEEVKQSKDNEEMQEFKEWLDKVSQNAKQNSVQLKKEIINSQMSVEATILEYAESGVDLIVVGTRGNSGIKNMFAWEYCIWCSQICNLSCNGSKIILNNVTVGTPLLPFA